MAPVMAPSPFGVQLSVGGAVGAVMAVNAVLASGAVGAVMAVNAVMASGAVGGVMAVGSGGGGGGAVGGGVGGAWCLPPRFSRAGEWRRPRNREWASSAPDPCALDLELLARFLGLEVLELSDTVGGGGIAARVKALARPSKTTPRPWVYEAGAREGLEI